MRAVMDHMARNLLLPVVALAVVLIGTSSACAMRYSAGDPTVRYVSMTGSDHSSCTQSAPCASFDQAFRVAPCGGTVVVSAGEYGPQTVNADPGKSACRRYTSMTVASGATVTINGSLALEASWMKVLGTESTADVAAKRRIGFDILGSVGSFVQFGAKSSADVVPDHVWIERTNSKSGYIAGATNVTFKGTNIGPGVSCQYGDSCAATLNGGFHEEDLFVIRSMQSADGTVHPNTNATLDGVFLHDLTKVYGQCATYPDSCGSHADCIQVYSFDHLTITNSTFWNCSDTDFFVKNDDGGWAPFHDLSIVNNQLGQTTYPAGYFDAQIVGGCNGVAFRYNTVIGHNIAIGCPADPSATVVEGNVLPAPNYGSCEIAVWSYNFFSAPDSTSCESSDAVAVPKVFAQPSRVSGKWLSLKYLVVAGSTVSVDMTVFQRGRMLGSIVLPAAPPLSGRIHILVWHPRRSLAQLKGLRFCARVSDGSSPASLSAPSCSAITP
jgi:hypothetical protein